MAQAKARPSAKRSGGSKKTPARSRGSSTRRTSTKSRASSRKNSSPKAGSHKSAPVAAVSGAADKATTAVGNATGKASSAMGKAKVPLLAGGAAIAGAAGGLALGARQARRGKGIAKAIPHRPQMKIRSRDLASAAKDVGSFGAQLGHLATEIQRTREFSNGKHRSPVEVVLEGLTARRGRA